MAQCTPLRTSRFHPRVTCCTPMSADDQTPQQQTAPPQDDLLPLPSGQQVPCQPPSRPGQRRWSREDTLAWMVGYIRRHANLPSRLEYLHTREDGPNESTIRLRFGGWQAAWQTALRVILDDYAALRGPDEPAQQVHPGQLAEPVLEITSDLSSAVLGGLRAGRRPAELARHLGVPRTVILAIRDELRVSLPEPHLGRSRPRSSPLSRTVLEQAWAQASWPASTLQLTRLVYGPHPTAEERHRMRAQIFRLVCAGRLNRTGRDQYELP